MNTLIAVSYDLCSALTEGGQEALAESLFCWLYTLYKEEYLISSFMGFLLTNMLINHVF